MASPARPAPTRPGAVVALWGAGAAVVALVHNRWWASPNLAFMSLITDRLGENPFGGGLTGDYLLTNVTGPVVARLVGQTAPHEYARLHLVILVLGCALALVLAHRRFGAATAAALAVVLALSPAVTVSMQWLGQPDPLTLSLGLAMTLVRPRWAVAVLAVVAGGTHPEQAVFLAAAVAVTRTRVLPGLDGAVAEPWRTTGLDTLAAVGGVGVGRLVTELYFRLADITITQPRTSFLDYGLGGFTDHHLQSPLAVAFLLWGPLWLVWGAGCWATRRGGPMAQPAARTGWWTAAAVAGVALVPVAVTLDETRVYAMITAPLLVALAVGSARLLEPLAARRRTLIMAGALAVALVVPGGFTAGTPAWAWGLDAGQFASFLGDGSHPGDLTLWLLGPFDFTIPTI